MNTKLTTMLVGAVFTIALTVALKKYGPSQVKALLA